MIGDLYSNYQLCKYGIGEQIRSRSLCEAVRLASKSFYMTNSHTLVHTRRLYREYISEDVLTIICCCSYEP